MLSLRTCLLFIFVGACGPKAPMTTATAGEDGSSGGDTVGASTSTTTTTTTTTTDPTTSAGTSGQSSFVVDPDMGGAPFIAPSESCLTIGGQLRCTPVECDPWQQNCPDGQKCSPWSADGDLSWDSLKCVLLDPNPDHPGDPCTALGNGVSGIDSCDLDSMCWNFDTETMTGTCVLRCTGGPDDPLCPPDHVCMVANDGVLNLCFPQCDPLAEDCPGDDVCVPDGDEFLCLFDGSGDEGQTFDTCEASNVCDAGLVCAVPTLASECDQDASGCCLPFCDTTLPAQCPGAMQQCLPWFADEPAPPGLENLGVCGIPG